MRVKVFASALVVSVGVGAAGCARTGDDVFPHVEAGVVDALVITVDAAPLDARLDARPPIDAGIDADPAAPDAGIDADPSAPDAGIDAGIDAAL